MKPKITAKVNKDRTVVVYSDEKEFFHIHPDDDETIVDFHKGQELRFVSDYKRPGKTNYTNLRMYIKNLKKKKEK